MATSFFNSWALWEKMTFVLAVAIAATFCLGFIKVAWRNRYVNKHRLVDEERRAKIQELRRSGQFIEPNRNLDIPFGVRAMQSGIQVEGIWISGSNTPVPGSIKQVPSSSRSSKSSLRLSFGETSQQSNSPTSTGSSSTAKQRDSVGSALDSPVGHHLTPGQPPTSSRASPGHHASYKPRRSSHLRFGGYGHAQFHEDTLAQLEGAAEPSVERIDGERLSRQKVKDATSSSSSEESFYEVPERHPDHNPFIVNLPKVATSTPHQAPQKAQHSKGNYTSVPLEDPEFVKLSTLTTPDQNSSQGNPFVKEFERDMSGYRRPSTEVTLVSKMQEPPKRRDSFVPGELHVNRASRRVNSGFEVLPAGTFGARSEFNGNQEWHQEDRGGEKRKSKLQKIRNSLSIGRPSLSSERS